MADEIQYNSETGNLAIYDNAAQLLAEEVDGNFSIEVNPDGTWNVTVIPAPVVYSNVVVGIGAHLIKIDKS